jgi:hypothetical protein
VCGKGRFADAGHPIDGDDDGLGPGLLDELLEVCDVGRPAGEQRWCRWKLVERRAVARWALRNRAVARDGDLDDLPRRRPAGSFDQEFAFRGVEAEGYCEALQGSAVRPAASGASFESPDRADVQPCSIRELVLRQERAFPPGLQERSEIRCHAPTTDLVRLLR